jgi:hypothetical protein
MSLRTAFTSTAGLGDTVAGDGLGAAVVGLGTPEAVTGATEAGLAADEAVVCPKILDIRLENIPISKCWMCDLRGRVRFYFAVTSSFVLIFDG